VVKQAGVDEYPRRATQTRGFGVGGSAFGVQDGSGATGLPGPGGRAGHSVA
jgi:hypothetical protein